MSKRNHRRTPSREMQRIIRFAQEHGLVVEFGRFGSYTVRDPRFDQIEECRDYMGSGIDPETYCPHTYPPCHGCRVPCATCEGHGTIRVGTGAAEPVPVDLGRIA